MKASGLIFGTPMEIKTRKAFAQADAVPIARKNSEAGSSEKREAEKQDAPCKH